MFRPILLWPSSGWIQFIREAIEIQHRTIIYNLSEDRGGTVVKVLFYKSEGRWFDPSWYHWNISLT